MAFAKQLLFLGLLIIFHAGKGQSPVNRMLRISEDVYKFTFSMPEGYHECDSGFTFYCRDSKLSSGISYSIIKSDSSVKIGLSFIPVMSHTTERNLRLFFSKIDNPPRNAAYFRNAEYLADTVHSIIEYYDSVYVRNKFNADHGLSISRDCKVPYQIWDHNRMVFLAKDDNCHIELTYLFTEKARKNIAEEIRRTEGMIRFK
jgi:hypothetical protein